MKDHIKSIQRLSYCRRQKESVDKVAWAVVGTFAFILVTAFIGIKTSLALTAILVSGLAVYRWHKRKYP